MSTDAMHDSVTSLTYVQLADALAASTAEQETRWTAFLAAADATLAEARGSGLTGETKAEYDGSWAAYQEQARMTSALANELTARIKRRDYA